MTNNSKRNLKVGITVIVSAFILIYGVAFLKDFKVGIETNDYVVYFKDVNGLKEGDPVSINGVIKGKVKKIDLVAGDSIQVDFYMAKDIVLKRDYNISVAMIELMSGKQIYIKPGNDPIAADMTKPFVGARTSDVVSLIGTVADIGDDVKSLTKELTKTTAKLNSTIEDVNAIVGDEGLKSNIRGTALNFNDASRNLKDMISDTRKNVGTLTMNLNGVVDKVGTTVDETRPEMKQTFEDIRLLTSKLDTLSNNLNLMVLSTRDSSNTVGKLLTQDDLYNNLNKTIESINKLVKQIKKDGLKFKIF